MNSSLWLRAACLALPAVFLGACGGDATTTGSAGEGGSGATGASSSGGSSSGGSSSGGSSSGGAGGEGGGSAGGGSGGAVDCEGLDQVSCLAVFPSCVPVYDDVCCSSCEPGPCTECTDIQYHHCTPKEVACTGEPLPCGIVPDWACMGGQAKCSPIAGLPALSDT